MLRRFARVSIHWPIEDTMDWFVRRYHRDQIPLADKVLACPGGLLTDSDTVTIRAPIPHGAYLVVIAPDGTQFFVIYPNSDDPSSQPISPTVFRTVEMFSLIVGESVGRPWVGGRDSLEVLFQQAGAHEIVVADNWESDVPSFVRRCSVNIGR